MCIRDSYALVAILGLLGKYGSLQLPGNLTALQNPWVIGVAVSYTHLTLPDDLLCVDLGGRRIIKKKT